MMVIKILVETESETILKIATDTAEQGVILCVSRQVSSDQWRI